MQQWDNICNSDIKQQYFLIKSEKKGHQNQNLIKRTWDIQTFEYVVKSNYDIKKLKKWCNEVKVLDVKPKEKKLLTFKKLKIDQQQK